MKCAIINVKNKSASVGGPAGYLFNLYSGADEINEFPDFIYLLENKLANSSITADSGSKITNIKELFPSLREFLYFFKQGNFFKKKLGEEIKEYGLIHVHTTETLLYLRWFCKYKGKVVFTPHRPETVREELVGVVRRKKKGAYRLLGKWYDILESNSYRLADAFIYPSEGAMSIYKSFPGFTKYLAGKEVRFLYTGIRKKEITLSREEYRLKNNIDKEAFVISYIGRHNAIKGYDRLVKVFPKFEKDNVEFVIAGKIESDDYPKNERWHELGYISDAQNLMNASDVIVIPNRNTYFDLVILEALSLGKIVITSNTGGNIDISKDTDALVLFDNYEEESLFRAISKIKNMSNDSRNVLEEAALHFYKENCTEQIFANNYIRIINEIKERI